MLDRVHNFVEGDHEPFTKPQQLIESATVSALKERIQELEIVREAHFKLQYNNE